MLVFSVTLGDGVGFFCLGTAVILQGPTEITPRNGFSVRVLGQYRKTAEAVAKHPWNMVDARAYLRQLCDDNEHQVIKEPPELIFFNQARSRDTECTAVSPGLLDWYDYAPDVPKRIEIAVPPKPRAKAAAARSAPVRMRLRAKTPEPPPALGCSKCRYAVNGCAVCKARRAKVVAGILKPPVVHELNQDEAVAASGLNDP